MTTKLSFPSDFPENCPPTDAIAPSGTYYRIVRQNPPVSRDFTPKFREDERQARRQVRNRHYTLCETMGLSMFREMEHVIQCAMQFPKLGGFIAEMQLGSQHGRIKLTGRRGDSHHTWWLPNDCEPLGLITDARPVQAM